MLRITRMVGDDSVEFLKLEGTLQGPWISEAHGAHAFFASTASRVRLELSGLTFADDEGAGLLRELIRQGAQVVGCSSYIAELLKRPAES